VRIHRRDELRELLEDIRLAWMTSSGLRVPDWRVHRGPGLALDLPPELIAVRINLLEAGPAQYTLRGLVVLIRERENEPNDCCGRR
jgi:hypothetical protein